jgi:hypothetical protein
LLGAGVLISALMTGRRPSRPLVRTGGALVLVAVGLAVLASEVVPGLSILNQARRQAVSASYGRNFCFRQGWPGNPAGSGAARLPFVHWLNARMGPNAVYTLVYSAPPDEDCVILGLLPALPAAPGERAQWTVAFGAVPKEMQAKIAVHDASVRVFGPGLALERNPGAIQ